VLQAVAEASNALVPLEQGRLRLNSAEIAETAAETSARGSRASYGAGIQSLQDRLQVEQQLIEANLAASTPKPRKPAPPSPRTAPSAAGRWIETLERLIA